MNKIEKSELEKIYTHYVGYLLTMSKTGHFKKPMSKEEFFSKIIYYEDLDNLWQSL